MTSPSRDVGRFTTFVSRAVFGVAIVVATWGYHQQFHNYPPYLDYDSATLGIFVNNVSFHDRYDFGFRDSPEEQNQYRADWAAHFLPASVVLSRIQLWFGIPPDRVGDLLKITGFVFGALGSLCAIVIARRGGRSTGEALFLFAFLAALPAFLLYLRTTVPHLLFSYMMFWLATLCMDRYLDEGTPRWIYALGVGLALYALVPYVPLAALPVVGIVLAFSRRAVGRTLRDPHLYAAGMVSVALFALLRVAVATTHDASFDVWATKAERFVTVRSKHALSMEFLDHALLPDKLAKLAHQHFYFRRDHLGDRSRKDHLWVFRRPHLVWLLLLPLAACGAFHSWRRRDRTAGVFATVLLALYGLTLSAGFPEGRYLIPAVPALAFFVLAGLRALVPAGNARLLAMAVVLVATAVESAVLIQGDYQKVAARRWRGMSGMRETLAVIRDHVDPAYGRERTVNLNWPGLRYDARSYLQGRRYESWLYLEMLGNMRVDSYPLEGSLATTAPGEMLFAAVEANETGVLQDLRRRGYHDLANVVDPVRGRELVVLAIEP